MNTIVDTTSELPRPSFPGTWVCFPMLDLVASDVTALRAAAEKIESARLHGPVLVCCALGYGRSVATLLVWLVRTGRATDLQAALRHLKVKRPRMALNARQLRAVAEAVGAG